MDLRIEEEESGFPDILALVSFGSGDVSIMNGRTNLPSCLA